MICVVWFNSHVKTEEARLPFAIASHHTHPCPCMCVCPCISSTWWLEVDPGLCVEDSFLGYQGDRRLGTTTSVKKSTIHAVGPMWRQDIGSSGCNSQWVKPYDFFVAPSLQTSPAPWWTGSSAALVGSLWVNGRVRRAQWIRGWLVWPENVHHSPCLRLPLNRHSWSRLRLARCPATLCMYLNLASVDNLCFHICFSVHKNDSFCCSILKKKSSTISYMSYYSLRSYL